MNGIEALWKAYKKGKKIRLKEWPPYMFYEYKNNIIINEIGKPIEQLYLPNLFDNENWEMYD